MPTGKLAWEEFTQSFQDDDGLSVRDSGEWAEDKLRWWHRYVDITTTTMADKPAWRDGVVYLDLFSGPGICRIRTTGRQLPGSPLIAAHAPKPFSKLLFCEMNPNHAVACEQRLKRSPASDRFHLFCGDCNQLVDEIAREIPENTLSLAFIDPTGLHANMETICRLSRSRKMDLLILFPDAVDVLRNVDHLYLPELNSNLDQVLGSGSDWRREWTNLGGVDGPAARRLFARIYRSQLQRLAGYQYFADETISTAKGPLYRLIFATKHERGLDFWDKVTLKEKSGQKRLDLF